MDKFNLNIKKDKINNHMAEPKSTLDHYYENGLDKEISQTNI